MPNVSCPLSDLSLRSHRSTLVGIALLLVFPFCRSIILRLWLQVPLIAFFDNLKYDGRSHQPDCSDELRLDLRDVLYVHTVVTAVPRFFL